MPHSTEQKPTGYKVHNNPTQLKPGKKSSSNFNAISTHTKETASVGICVRAACLFSHTAGSPVWSS